MRREDRGPWYLLTGLVLGAFLGLMYAWLVQPTQYTDTKPASLRADFKDRYRALIASAYMSNGDLVRAKARLELLQDADLYRMLSEQAQRTLAGAAPPSRKRAPWACWRLPWGKDLPPSPACRSKLPLPRLPSPLLFRQTPLPPRSAWSPARRSARRWAFQRRSLAPKL